MFQTLWKYNNPSSIRYDEKLDVIQGNRYWTAQKHVSQKVCCCSKRWRPIRVNLRLCDNRVYIWRLCNFELLDSVNLSFIYSNNLGKNKISETCFDLWWVVVYQCHSFKRKLLCTREDSKINFKCMTKILKRLQEDLFIYIGWHLLIFSGKRYHIREKFWEVPFFYSYHSDIQASIKYWRCSSRFLLPSYGHVFTKWVLTAKSLETMMSGLFTNTNFFKFSCPWFRHLIYSW